MLERRYCIVGLCNVLGDVESGCYNFGVLIVVVDESSGRSQLIRCERCVKR